MRNSEERYISLLTDFGFKRVFGTVPNKDLLIDFLNSLFDGEQVVKDVTFLNSEHVGDISSDRKAIFDVYCENEQGEKFIVEMQNAYQTFFKDRSLYYATFPIREQAEKGDVWDYQLKHVYVVALLNYKMSDSAFSPDTINHDIGLLDKQTHRVFNDKLTFKYVEISKFDKCLEELESNYDKWLYVLRNLSRLDSQPDYLRNEIFNRLFSEAEIASPKWSSANMRTASKPIAISKTRWIPQKLKALRKDLVRAVLKVTPKVLLKVVPKVLLKVVLKVVRKLLLRLPKTSCQLVHLLKVS